MESTLAVLLEACGAGCDIETVEDILSKGEVDVNGTDDEGNTPLMKAMWFHHRDHIVRRLLAHPELQLDKCDDHGGTALHHAAYTNNVSVISLFCKDKRCTPSIINMKNTWREAALSRAVSKGYLDFIKELDKVVGVDFILRDIDGSTLIDVARGEVRREGKRNDQSDEVLEYLLSRKVESLEEIAAYNIAKYVENKNEVEALEIPPTLKPLVTQCMNGKIKRRGITTQDMCTAAINGDIKKVEKILIREELDINYGHPTQNAGTPLMHAMKHKRLDIVSKFLTLPFLHLDKSDMKGNTALHWACNTVSGNEDFPPNPSVISLFCRDIRCTPSIINKKNNDGRTALMMAVRLGNIEIVKELDKVEGADFDTKDNDGRTLIEVAMMCKEGYSKKAAIFNTNRMVSYVDKVLEFLIQKNKKVVKK